MSVRWCFFISGRGSNAQAAFNDIEEVPIALVMSNRKHAEGVYRARRAGIPVCFLEQPTDWKIVLQVLAQYRITHLFLLGFMKIIPIEFLETWRGVIANLHPSLLPHFPGKDAFNASLQAGGPYGVSVHLVTPVLDAGPLVKQKKIDLPLAELELRQSELRLALEEQSLVRNCLQKLSRSKGVT